MAAPVGLDICQDADVIRRIGGQVVLVELLPLTTDPSQYDADALQQIRWDAAEEVASRANVQVQVQAWAQAIAQNPALSWPWLLVDFSAWLATDLCWPEGSAGQAKPPHLIERAKQIREVDLEKLRRNELSIGAPPAYPQLQPMVQTVNMDPGDTRMTVQSFQRWIA